MTPTSRTMQAFRKLGYTVDKVEHRVPVINTLKDAFGFIDILVLGASIIGVQATSKSNVTARKKKIQSLDAARLWLVSGGRILVVGWYPSQKVGACKWLCDSYELTIKDGRQKWISLPEIDG